jgi:hypothetical protein
MFRRGGAAIWSEKGRPVAAFPPSEGVANRYVSGVQTQEACNKDDNYHYADDVENVHCVLRSRHARFQYESAALEWERLGGTVRSIVH